MSVFTKLCTGLLLSALSFSAHAANAPLPPNPPQNPQEQTIDVANTPEVIQALYVGNAAEIKLAMLVSQKNSDADLAQFATEISNDHSFMNKLLAVIANVKSVSLKSEEFGAKVQKIAADMDAAYNTLSQVPDTEFRKAFLQAAIAEHQMTLELYSRIEAGNTDDAVKLSIAVFRQLTEKHLADAQKLQAGTVPPQDSETN